MSLAVLALNAGATLQDGGRKGYLRFGVPAGGAFDRASFQLGNALLGNEPSAAALELTVMGGRFEADSDHVLALVGGEAPAAVEGAPLPARAAFTLRKGQVLEVGGLTRGVRAYLCAAGGFTGDLLLGSVSGTVVRKGDTLAVGSPAGRASAAVLAPPGSFGTGPIRIVQGPQADALAGADLVGRRFAVSSRSNRVGLRLEGDPFPRPSEIVSEPMCVGAIQLTNDGGLIVIGPDGPTVGGYPKVACVIDADWDRFAQLPPGDPVTFEWVSLPEALALGESYRMTLRAQADALRTQVGPKF